MRQSLITDDIHAWIGAAAVLDAGQLPSQFPLTDDERLLRDLAYPLIAPPYDRVRWYAVIEEYGLTHRLSPDLTFERENYFAALFSRWRRSTTSLYAQFIEDVRNDVTRIGPFFVTARKVSDMDVKREKSFAYVSELSGHELVNARRRIAENALIVDWVKRSLVDRAAAYQFAIERLVIITPSPSAADAERALTLYKTQIGLNPQMVPVVAVKRPLIRKD